MLSKIKIPIQLLVLAKDDIKYLTIGGFLILSIGSYFVKKYKKAVKELKKKNYPKNVVILHRLRKGFNMPHWSPAHMKLETWLRFTNIPYNYEFDVECNKRGIFITYNEEEIEGAQKCIDFLSKKLNINLDEHLNEKEKAISRCFQHLVEQSLKWVVGLSIFVYEPDRLKSGLSKLELKLGAKKAKEITYSQGYGRHTTEESYTIGIADLKSLSDFIDNKKYLMGDKICSTDASIFSSLSQIKNHDKGKLNNYIINRCPNLVKYHDRIKNEYWQNWDELIQNKNTEEN